MLEGFRKHMPEEVTWTEPEGGLFLFMTLPSYMDAENLLKKAIIHKVAFVAGNVFFADNGGRNTIRINFSYASMEENRTGVERLAEVIREEVNKKR
jgi:2-aminoadipate transaminase